MYIFNFVVIHVADILDFIYLFIYLCILQFDIRYNFAKRKGTLREAKVFAMFFFFFMCNSATYMYDISDPPIFPCKIGFVFSLRKLS